MREKNRRVWGVCGSNQVHNSLLRQDINEHLMYIGVIVCVDWPHYKVQIFHPYLKNHLWSILVPLFNLTRYFCTHLMLNNNRPKTLNQTNNKKNIDFNSASFHYKIKLYHNLHLNRPFIIIYSIFKGTNMCVSSYL